MPTTYYVDATGGSDANDGQSPGSAWQSLSRIPADQLQPGDQVLLKAGEVFRGSLSVNSSGTVDQPITVGSYGTGAPPEIRGSAEVSHATWTETAPGSHIWTTDVPAISGEGPPISVVFDGVKGNPSAVTQAQVDAPGDWFWANGKLSVYSLDPPPGAFGSLEVQLYGSALQVQSATYVTIDGVNTSLARNGFDVSDSYGVVIRNFESYLNGRHGVFVNNSAYTVVEDGSAHDNGILGAGSSNTRIGSGVLLRSESNNNTVQNLDLYNNAEDGIQVAKDGGDNNVFDHNQMHGNVEDGVDIKHGSQVVTNNLMFDNGANGILIHQEGRFVVVTGNEIHIRDSGSGNALVIANQANVQSEGNQYYGTAAFTIQINTTAGDNSTFTHDLIVGGGRFSGVAVSVQGGDHNVFDDVVIVMPFPGEAVNVSGKSQDTEIVNSVISGTGAPLVHSSDGHDAFTDHNLYYRLDSAGNWIRVDGPPTRMYGQGDIDSGAIFTVEGTDQNSHTGNPLFVDPSTGDYRLQPGSPAIDDGWDIVAGGPLGDTVDGLGGNDLLLGQGGADSLNGGNDNDMLDGGTEADTLSGDAGNDTVLGGEGDDSLNGGDGDDVVEGGLGSDIVAGGTGRDTFVIAVESPATDTIADLEVNDIIAIAGVSLTGAIGIGDATNVAPRGVNVQASGGNTLLFVNIDDTPQAEITIQLTGTVSTSDLAIVDGAIHRVGPAVVLVAGFDDLAGASPIYVQAAPGTIEAGDNLVAGVGYDELHLTGAGSYDLTAPAAFSGFEAAVFDVGGATLALRGDAALTVLGSGDADTVVLNTAKDTVRLGGGDDQVQAGSAAIGQGDLLDGGTGYDTLALTGGGTFDLKALGSLAGFEQVTLIDPGTLIKRDGTDVLVVGSGGNDTVELSNGPDRLELGEGDDTVVAASDNFRWDSLDAGGGTDTLLLKSDGPYEISDIKLFSGFEIVRFAEGTFTGKTLAHLIVPGDLSLSIFGSSGNDKVSLSSGAIFTGLVSLDFGGGDDQLRISAGANLGDQLNGGTGIDQLRFFGGGTLDLSALAQVTAFEQFNFDDAGTLVMRNGAPATVQGSVGADTLVLGSGAETVDLRDGRDTVDYSRSTAAVTVNLTTGVASGGYAAGDTLAGVENVVGSNGFDKLTGSDGANEMWGGAGRDSLDGLGGNDTLHGDDRIDTLNGGDGNDMLYGGGDRDNLFGGADDDKLFGDAGDDMLDGGTGNDELGGGEGADRLFGQDGLDSLTGALGNDTLDGGTGDDTMAGGPGNDTYYADSSADQVVENIGEGTDTVYVTATTFTLPHDVEILIMQGAAVSATGNETANSIFGNGLDNSISGAGGNDKLAGGDGLDTINGGFGDDSLRGDAGSDSLDGGSGKDTLVGGAGVDTLTGGDKADYFQFDNVSDSGIGAGNRDIITDFNHDKIDLRGIDANDTVGGNQAFAFVGAAAFSAAGQVRAFDDGADTVIQGDTNGDGNADFEIVLQGHAGQPLLGTDFLL